MACCCSCWPAAAVTLGLMNFVNLAHGAFAMVGGYVCAVLVNRSGLPFFAALPIAFLASAAIGAVAERTLYRHLYARNHLDRCCSPLVSFFMSVTACDYFMGSSQVFIQLPAYLQGQIDIFGLNVGRYRLMIIVICGFADDRLADDPVKDPVRQPLARRGG